MATEERHIVALNDLGSKLYGFLIRFLDHYQDRDSYLNYVYKETFSQLVLAMDYSKDEFFLRLPGIPNYAMFKHIPEFNNPAIRSNYELIIKNIAPVLVDIIYSETNPELHRAEYQMESITITYMVLVKRVLGLSNFSNINI